MLIEISPDTIENFRALAPMSQLLKIGKDPNYFGIGHTESLEVPPDGVLLFCLESDEDERGELHTAAVLKYFATAEDKREQGIFAGLFDAFQDLLEGTPTEAVRADIPMGEEYNDACGILENMGFVFSLADLFELRTTLGEMAALPIYQAHLKKHVAVLLKDVPDNLFGFAVEKLNRELFSTGSYELSLDRAEYDQDVSVVLLKDQIPVSLFLIRENEDGELENMVLRVREGTEVPELMKTAMFHALRKFGRDKPVRMVARTEAAANLIDRLFPGVKAIPIRRGYLMW